MQTNPTNSPFVTFSQKSWEGRHDKVWNEEFKTKIQQAAAKGFFYMEMPEDCKKIIASAVEFANNFYKIEAVRSIKRDGFTGYQDRKDFQNERVILEEKYWSEYLTPEIQEVAKRMKEIGGDIIKTMYRNFGIDESMFEKLSGGVTSNKGSTHLTFNHYRCEKELPGIRPHKDLGQVTVLFIDKVGLEVEVDGQWKDVKPLKDHFVINFGRQLETLINDTTKLVAAIHRVPQLVEDRISFGVFEDNAGDSPMYQQKGSEYVVFYPNSHEYIAKGLANAYPIKKD